MGILNVTPDSFSDGGLFETTGNAVQAALAMADEGAAIVDVGGESTRPGGDPVDAETEQRRILPVIAELARVSDVLISVDTYRADTARRAVEAGAHIVNDVWGLHRDPAMAATVAQSGAGVCIMHTGRERRKADDVINDQLQFLGQSLILAKEAGLAETAIVLDPGFGFAKNSNENMELMMRFYELNQLGFPLIAGTSRKRFIGAVSGRDMDDRDIATAATTALLRMQGAAIFRVHDVATNRDALSMADAGLTVEWNKDQVMSETIQIRLKNCAFFGRHGAFESEYQLGQRFYVDIDMEVLPTKALSEDNLGSTVDYGAVFAVAQNVVQEERFYLIEALAHHIGTVLCETFGAIRKVCVVVRKPSAPIAGILDYAEVRVECTQDD